MVALNLCFHIFTTALLKIATKFTQVSLQKQEKVGKQTFINTLLVLEKMLHMLMPMAKNTHSNKAMVFYTTMVVLDSPLQAQVLAKKSQMN